MDKVLVLSSEELEQLTQEIVDRVSAVIRDVVATPSAEKAVGREELAQLLGVGIATVDRLVRQDVIPSMMPCQRRLFLPSRVYAALESKQANHTSNTTAS